MTIDTSREAVERLAKTHNSFEDYPDLYDMGKRPPCKKTAQVLTALLAERDAALAEVARLSHAHAALRAKLAEAETERNTLRSENSGLNHILWMMEADRDEERKLADDAVHELKHARAVLRHEQYLDDPGREAVIARHAARRKWQQG